MSKSSTKYLVVVRGSNTGARIALGEHVRTVGRARDADLVLPDATVSRHHLQLRATDTGAHVQVCGDAAPFLLDGCETNAAQMRVGDSLLVGNTLLLLSDADGRVPGPDSVTTNIPSLLTGVAADVRGLAAIFALNEALLGAADAPAIEAALASWAKENAECETVELVSTDGEPEAADPKSVVETAAPNGGTRILVPAQGAPARWFAFTLKLPPPPGEGWGGGVNVAPHRVTDSLRR
ncbi:MAG TPA: FHA domain-containing protein, partial [Polyangiaceae bacterium]|nr:FHA domain-containing protein [Polyangiaceae bacterium]